MAMCPRWNGKGRHDPDCTMCGGSGVVSTDNIVRPRFPEPPLPPPKVATFTLGVDGFKAEVDEVAGWTQSDWRNLILAAVRTAQMHGADIRTILAEFKGDASHG